MGFSSQSESREVRAARNQSLFRAVNERLKLVDQPFIEDAGTYVVACECADLDCIETLEIGREKYAEIRADARHFVVLEGHVYPDVERVVEECDGYVVVEKVGLAAAVAMAAEPESDGSR
jgi:hypothetical protein